MATANCDWAAIRAAYESAEASDRALAREFGVSHTAIQKRAKQDGWVKAAQPNRPSVGVYRPIPEIAAPPSLAAAGSRDLIEGGRDLAVRLLDELDATTTHLGEIEALIEDYTADDKDGARRHAMLKAVNLSSRAVVLKNLALVAKTLSEVGAGGKKAEAASRAADAGKSGKFAAPAAPKLVVNNR